MEGRNFILPSVHPLDALDLVEEWKEIKEIKPEQALSLG